MPGENILHFNAVRLRVTGVGNLKMEFISLDDMKIQELKPIPMLLKTDREPTRLANFISQRARFKVSLDHINERFVINRIIIYAKELYSSYPG
jgi:hypothetical protein